MGSGGFRRGFELGIDLEAEFPNNHDALDEHNYLQSPATCGGAICHLRWGHLPSAKRVEVHRLTHLRIEMWATGRGLGAALQP